MSTNKRQRLWGGTYDSVVMRRVGSSIIAVFAFIASIVLHVTVLSEGLVALLMSAGPALRQTPPHMPDAARVAPAPDQQKLKLGIEESTATTVTWIGYREYEEHIAELRRFEQAAFTVQPARPMVVEQVPLAIPMPAPDTAKAALADALAARPPARQFLLPILRGAIDEAFLISQRDGAGESPTAGAAESDAPAAVESARERQAAGAPPAPPAPVDVEVTTPPAEPVVSEPRTGDPAEKESAPTSLVKAMPEHWRVGKPLAAYGLELLPRGPELTDLQRITTSPGNPIVEFAFDSRGVPVEASIIEHSGDSRVDSTILASLYRWRAKGERLGKLAEGELQRVQIRIVLNPRAPY